MQSAIHNALGMYGGELVDVLQLLQANATLTTHTKSTAIARCILVLLIVDSITSLLQIIACKCTQYGLLL